MDTWERRIVEMFGGMKMGQRAEINFHSASIPAFTQYFYKPRGDYYDRAGGKDCRILEALRQEEDPLKIQARLFTTDKTAEYCSVDTEISKVSSTWTTLSSPLAAGLHRLFHLTFSVLRRVCNSWQYESQPGWVKSLHYWLRKNLLYPSELHYVGRTILIAAISTEVLVQTATRLNLNLNQLVMDSGIQLVCLSGLCGIYKEFHFF